MGSTTVEAAKNKSTNKKLVPTKAKATVSKSNEGGDKKSAQQVMLERLAQAYSLGEDSMERDRFVSTCTGLKPKTIQNNLPKLKNQGLIEMNNKTISLTTKGLEQVGDLAHRPTSNAEHQANMLRTLKNGKQVRMFEMLANGETREKLHVAQQLGYDNAKVKAFQNLIGAMRSQGLVEYPEKTTVRLTDGCFLKARGEE